MMKFPFSKQLDSMDCGPACLQMIVRYYGKKISIKTLREKTQKAIDGVSMLGIIQAANSFGFESQLAKVSLDYLLEDGKLPCIIHWNENHFVVLHKINDQRFFIADPARSKRILPVEEFRSYWCGSKDEGVVLFLRPTDVFHSIENEKIEGFQIGMKRALQYALPYKNLFRQVFLGLAILSFLQMVFPFLTQSVIDIGINNSNLRLVYIILLAQSCLILGKLSIDLLRSWLLLHISTRINMSITTDFLKKLMKLPVSFFEGKKVGDILQRMNDQQRIDSFLTGSSVFVLFSFVNYFIFSVVLGFFSKSILLVSLLFTLVYVIWVLCFLERRKNLDYKRFEYSAKDQSMRIQMVQGMQEIKLGGIERQIRWSWERLQAHLFGIRKRALELNQWQTTGATFLIEAKNLCVIGICAYNIINGTMSLGAMMAVQFIMGQLGGPISDMIAFIQNWQLAKISLERFSEVHSLPEEENQDKILYQEIPLHFSRGLVGGIESQVQDLQLSLSDNDQFLEVQPSEFESIGHKSSQLYTCIEFRKCTFRYPGAGNQNVLEDISISIPTGKTTAIVGASGSGKTSLLKLLLKFYEPTDGDIFIGQVPLCNISHMVWRRHCGAVMQDSFIFSDTIINNIVIGDESIDEKRLSNALEMANIADFIRTLPAGLETKIGYDGKNISQGERQRILIARVIYKDPDFMFLDEATNNLDSVNENMIVHNLEKFITNRTVVIVAHRLSTVKNADQIIVLDKGKISERGTHTELVAKKGYYYNLIRNQLELGS